MTLALASELASYLRAGYPFVAIETHEEQRVLALLKDVATTAGRRLIPLSVTIARRFDTGGGFQACLDQLATTDEPALFVLLDADPHLDNLAVRTLRDLKLRLTQRRQTVVMVSPVLHIPEGLAPDVVSFTLPLPDVAALEAGLMAQCRELGISLGADVVERAARAVRGMTLDGGGRAFRRALTDPAGALQGGDASGLVDEKRRLLRRSDLLEFIDTPPPLQAVGGLQALKEWLVEREAAFTAEARAFGLPVPKGLLLVGVQGCGKSLTAKAVASLWNLPLARLDFGALFTFGSSPEQNLRRVLRVAEALAPVVLWLDEIDKAFASVSSNSGGSESLGRVFAGFITWMQEKTSPAFVVATANAVDHLPAELLRKGRFDETFFVDLPSAAERTHILRIHLQRNGREPARFDLDDLSKRCEHFSGAELEQVVVGGLYRAFQGKRELNDQDMRLAADGTVPLYRTAEESIKGLREWAKRRARRASPDARLVELWGA